MAGKAGTKEDLRERLPVYLPPDKNRGTDGREGGAFAALHVFRTYSFVQGRLLEGARRLLDLPSTPQVSK